MEPVTINCQYELIKKYYDDVLNADTKLIETSNDEPTPLSCVEEMINKIPDEFWENPNHKILDPCCGCGNFPVVMYFKLIKHHSKEHILKNMLYFNDININRLNVLRKIFDYTNLNIYTSDFLAFETEIKFDLIVANPPICKTSSKWKTSIKKP